MVTSKTGFLLSSVSEVTDLPSSHIFHRLRHILNRRCHGDGGRPDTSCNQPAKFSHSQALLWCPWHNVLAEALLWCPWHNVLAEHCCGLTRLCYISIMSNLKETEPWNILLSSTIPCHYGRFIGIPVSLFWVIKISTPCSRPLYATGVSILHGGTTP